MNLKRKSGWLVHGLVAVCALALLGAMAAITRGTLSAERERALAESRAIEQENMRLALWRMDAAATAWIADEAQRPVISTSKQEPPKPEVLLRFEVRDDGSLLSNGTPRLDEFGSFLGELAPANGPGGGFQAICAAMPELPSAWSSPAPAESAPPPAQTDRSYQQIASSKELANRGRAVKGALDVSQHNFLENVGTWNVANSIDWSLQHSGLPRPAWIRGELFLLRHLEWKRPGGGLVRSVQGSWLDAGALQATLLAEVADLFPRARLLPVAASEDEAGMTLASLPWKFDAGNGKLPRSVEIPRAVLMPLIAAWAAALLAIAAAWLLVGGLLRLSEKRASFVSAVTHELRTPLTTFQLYSEMLESGAVKEEKRGDYFRTLRREAERLSHLVENVLAFSRIERGSARATSVEIAAGELVEPMHQRLAERLLEAGLSLKSDLADPAWHTVVKADAAAVEHVLFNLIDNAAKYAAGADRPEVHLEAAAAGRFLELRVRDHGPGISNKERRRVFRAFHKSAAAAAESRPGVGLGLSLSRRLARTGGGDLKLAEADGGACFVLTLPLAR